MTDRELLEKAAKAAGINIYESTDGTIQARPVWVFLGGGGMGTMPYEVQWNPLGDDAQALRLAVKLFIDIQHSKILGIVEAWVNGACVAVEEYIEDKESATRRAIVRAAAAIGESL